MTPQDALQTLMEAVKNCQRAGLNVGVAPLFGSLSAWMIFLPNGVTYGDGRLSLIDRQIRSEEQESLSF